MAKYKIKFDKEACIGCGACAAQCPDNWEMEEGSEAKAKPKKVELDELGCNKAAEEGCPVNAIKIVEE